MNDQERQLITGLFERMRNLRPVDKDPEAQALIAMEARSVPDALYLLAQTVLVQEMALQKADQRIRELEASAVATPRASGRSGGFLSTFGLGPAANSDAADAGPGTGPGAGGSVPRAGPPSARSGPGPSAGGGFLSTALSTAVGVAGGMLLSESIRTAMGGTAGGTAQAAGAGSPAASSQPATEQKPQYQDANDNDPGLRQDAKNEASRPDQADHHDDDDDDDDDYDGDFDGGMDV